jgi:hypothetical protein
MITRLRNFSECIGVNDDQGFIKFLGNVCNENDEISVLILMNKILTALNQKEESSAYLLLKEAINYTHTQSKYIDFLKNLFKSKNLLLEINDFKKTIQLENINLVLNGNLLGFIAAQVIFHEMDYRRVCAIVDEAMNLIPKDNQYYGELESIKKYFSPIEVEPTMGHATVEFFQRFCGFISNLCKGSHRSSSSFFYSKREEKEDNILSPSTPSLN